MPYRLTLTTEDGEVLGTWKVINGGDRGDEDADISVSFAGTWLLNEIRHEINLAEGA